MTRTSSRALWVVALMLVLLAVDQSTKRLVFDLLVTAGSTYKLPGPLDLTLVFNRSNAFSVAPDLGELSRWGLVALNLVVALALILWSVRPSTGALAAAGMAVLAAGAVGNAIDRCAFGFVIDFIDASEMGFPWVFNVADALIDLGIGLLLLSSVLGVRPTPSRTGEDTPPA